MVSPRIPKVARGLVGRCVRGFHERCAVGVRIGMLTHQREEYLSTGVIEICTLLCCDAGYVGVNLGKILVGDRNVFAVSDGCSAYRIGDSDIVHEVQVQRGQEEERSAKQDDILGLHTFIIARRPGL